jgi:hypothetical protein
MYTKKCIHPEILTGEPPIDESDGVENELI